MTDTILIELAIVGTGIALALVFFTAYKAYSTASIYDATNEQLENLQKKYDKMWERAETEAAGRMRVEIELGLEIQHIAAKLNLYTFGVDILLAQLRKADITPMWEPPKDATETINSYDDRRDLLAQMNAHLSAVDVHQLAFVLNASYDNLPGDTKREKIMALIEYIYRDQRAADMMDALRQMRPNIGW